MNLNTWKFWTKAFWTRCKHCGSNGATRNRQSTKYNVDEYNFNTLCPACQDAENKYWQETWSEYHRSVL